MATGSDKVSHPSSRCLLLLGHPICGESIRGLVRSLSPIKKIQKSIKNYCTRLPVASFGIGDVGQAIRLREELLTRCRGLVEIVEGSCIVRCYKRKPPLSYVLVGKVAIVSVKEDDINKVRESVADLIENTKGIEAVYAKIEVVGEERAPRLVHIWGTSVDEVLYKEHGLLYPVKLGKVYVNPRLAEEHRRMVKLVDYGENILDMFCGIGGFSLLLSASGKPDVIVANDINLWALRSLTKALQLNRSRLKSPVLVVNSDAGILHYVLRPLFDRFILNLPHRSYEYIGVVKKLCKKPYCVAHFYLIGHSEDEVSSLIPGVFSVRRVLDYAPRKYIFRVDAEIKRSI